MHYEIHSYERKVNRDSFERVRPCVKHAGLIVQRLQNSPRGRHALGNRLDRRVQGYAGAVRIRHVGKRLGNEGREISFRRLARPEARRGLEFAFDAVHAKSSPVLAGQVPRDEIPTMPGMDYAVRLDAARTGYARSILVVETDALMIAAGARDDR